MLHCCDHLTSFFNDFNDFKIEFEWWLTKIYLAALSVGKFSAGLCLKWSLQSLLPQ